MEINILEKKENPLLRRTEIIADISYEGVTPTRKDMREEISKKLKISPELTIIRHIYPFFGDRKAEVVVHVYQKKEDVEKIESKVYLERMIGKKKEKKEEKKEEEEAEEKEERAEEKKEVEKVKEKEEEKEEKEEGKKEKEEKVKEEIKETKEEKKEEKEEKKEEVKEKPKE